MGYLWVMKKIWYFISKRGPNCEILFIWRHIYYFFCRILILSPILMFIFFEIIELKFQVVYQQILFISYSFGYKIIQKGLAKAKFVIFHPTLMIFFVFEFIELKASDSLSTDFLYICISYGFNYKLRWRANKSRFLKFERCYLSSNFNAVFLQNDHLYGLLMNNNKMIICMGYWWTITKWSSVWVIDEQ